MSDFSHAANAARVALFQSWDDTGIMPNRDVIRPVYDLHARELPLITQPVFGLVWIDPKDGREHLCEVDGMVCFETFLCPREARNRINRLAEYSDATFRVVAIPAGVIVCVADAYYTTSGQRGEFITEFYEQSISVIITKTVSFRAVVTGPNADGENQIKDILEADNAKVCFRITRAVVRGNHEPVFAGVDKVRFYRVEIRNGHDVVGQEIPCPDMDRAFAATVIF